MPGVLVVGFTLWVLYLLTGAIYRLYFHPLAKFPGPKLAGLTKWYEFYHDIVHTGCFIWKLDELHNRYGPIVRITPEELHIRDSEYYDYLYAPSAKKRDKHAGFVVMAGAPASSFAAVSHDLHRLRRSALNQFFSKRSVQQMEWLIMDKIELLSQRFESAIKTQEVVRLDVAYMALTMDIIAHYAFGESYNHLAEDDFNLAWKETVVGGSANGSFLRQFPWMFPIMKAIPFSLLQVLKPQAALLVGWQHLMRRQIEEIMQASGEGKKAEGTIFQELLDSDLPEEEKSADRLQDEAQTVVGGGSETTAKALSLITFYLLQDKKKLYILRDELRSVPRSVDGRRSLKDLEQLPYLTAVINEGIRLMYGVTTRLPRVAPIDTLKYQAWEIPPGTPVSMSSYFVHMDETIFSSPELYDPDRWIRAASKGVRLDRYLVSFSKGSRICVGINLAYAELYLTLSTILSRFEIENFETTVDDVKMHRDYFVGAPKPGSKGVRAQILAYAQGSER